MYIAFYHLHSFLAWLALAALLAAIGYAGYNWANKQPFTKTSKILAISGMGLAHVQLIIGFILYFVSPLGFSNLSGDTMGDSLSRLYALEHPLTMLIAIILITVGYSTAKRLVDDNLKHKRIVIFYSIGLFLILLRIPWNAWP